MSADNRQVSRRPDSTGLFSLPPGIAQQTISLRDVYSLADDRLITSLEKGLQAASHRRKLEFIAGRYCAAKLLHAFGYSSWRLEAGPSGEPLWPTGIVGSITHSNSVASAVLTENHLFSGVGVDSEEILKQEGFAEVLCECITPSERFKFNLIHPSSECRKLATLIFSAKESFYKTVFPTVRRFIDFSEVQVIDIDMNAGSLRFDTTKKDADLYELCRKVSGGFRYHCGAVHTYCLLPPVTN